MVIDELFLAVLVVEVVELFLLLEAVLVGWGDVFSADDDFVVVDEEEVFLSST